MPRHGRAVQVDPVKPTSKAPGTKRLQLNCEEPLSNFAFNFKLRRYIMSGFTDVFYADRTARFSEPSILLPCRPPYYDTLEAPDVWFAPTEVWEAGAYTRPLFGST